MLHYECKFKYHVHEGLRECGRTEEEEEGKSMQSINRGRKDQVDKSKSNKENKLTKETKMPFFFFTLTPSGPFWSPKERVGNEKQQLVCFGIPRLSSVHAETFFSTTMSYVCFFEELI